MSEINEKKDEDNQNVTQREDKNETPSITTNSIFVPQEMMDKPCGCGGKGNCSCGSEKKCKMEKSFVYAIGRIQPKFPSPWCRKRILSGNRKIRYCWTNRL